MTEQGFADLLTRREALQRLGVLTGGALAAPLVSGMLSGCRAAPPAATFIPRTLTGGDYELVGTLTDIILPATDTPGARDAGVPAYIDEMLTTWYPQEDREAFLAGLIQLESKTESLFGASFNETSTENQTHLMKAIAQRAFPSDSQDDIVSDVGELSDTLPSLFKTLKQLTVVGYYTSETGATEELRQPRMGAYRADIPYNEIGRAWS